MDEIKLTQFSHGAGCGCKIAPQILEQILQSNSSFPNDKKLLVGNSSKDDAAVYDLGNGTALISTTDFFMPIVDDATDFGKIASANAINAPMIVVADSENSKFLTGDITACASLAVVDAS